LWIGGFAHVYGIPVRRPQEGGRRSGGFEVEVAMDRQVGGAKSDWRLNRRP